MVCYNDFATPAVRQKIVGKVAQGKIVALVSDAGTPLISDPGYKLVQEALKQGLSVTALPGASAIITALTLSGLPTDRFYFGGFLPAKQQGRVSVLEAVKAVDATLVFYESANRLTESLEDIRQVLGEREAVVARELTKTYEEVKRGSLEELVAWSQEHPPRGEMVVMIASPGKEGWSEEEVIAALSKAMEEMSVKDAVAFVTEHTGMPKREVYRLALGLKA